MFSISIFGSGVNNGQLINTLPDEYRPQNNVSSLSMVKHFTSHGIVQMNILSNGNVKVDAMELDETITLGTFNGIYTI